MKRIAFVISAIIAIPALDAQAIRSNAGFTQSSVPRNDDGSSPLTDIGFTINFFGKLRSSCWVNNNGNLTFDASLSEFTPFGLQRTAREIIAPFFAGVDTRPMGSKLATYGQDTVDGHKAFGANYLNVGYYACHEDKLNSFQVVLMDRADTGSGNFDIEFNYAKVTWETGDASGGVGGFGGVPVVVGWSNGTTDEGTSFELEGSFLSRTFLDNGSRALIRQHMNTNAVGRLLFRAREGQISPGLGIVDGSVLPNGTMGTPYAAALTATGAKPPFRWSFAPDVTSVPGLTFNSNGTVAGTPTATGTYTFTMSVTASTEDGDQTLFRRGSITIHSPSLSITNACPMREGLVGSLYSQTLAARGGSSGYVWSVNDAYALPPGMGLTPAGQFAGTPVLAGMYSFTLKAASTAADGSTPVEKPCSISVAPASVRLAGGCQMPGGTLGIPYSQTLTPAGGIGPYRFQLAGQLPAGRNLDADGKVTGIPSVAATYPFDVAVIDSRRALSANSCAITIQPAAFSVASACPLPQGTTGLAYAAQLPSTYTWSLGGGSLPAGIFLSPDGLLSGTPMSAGPSRFRLIAVDASGRQAGQSCSLAVLRGPLSVAGCPLPTATLNASYSANLNPVGGTSPYLFTALGTLPAGISVSRSGFVSGKASVSGDYPFSVQVLDGDGQMRTQGCTLAVLSPQLEIVGQCPLPAATLGQSYSAQFAARGGTAPYRFEFAGFLPDGFDGLRDGTLTGVPRSLGGISFLVQVTDVKGQAASKVCSLSAALPGLPQISIADPPSSYASASTTASVGIVLSQAYPFAITGQAKLAVAPGAYSYEGNANQPDPRLRFTNGQTTTAFTLPAGTTRVNLPLFSTGTVAGTVTISLANLKSAGADLVQAVTPKVFRILAAAPTITNACYTRNATGINLQISGFSTTRELTNASLAIGGNTYRIDVSGLAADYFSSDESIRFGGTFTLTVPQALAIAQSATLGTVSLNLTNSLGSAGPRTISLCQ